MSHARTKRKLFFLIYRCMERFAGFWGPEAIVRSFLRNLSFRDFLRMSLTKSLFWASRGVPRASQPDPSCHAFVFPRLSRRDSCPSSKIGGACSVADDIFGAFGPIPRVTLVVLATVLEGLWLGRSAKVDVWAG